MGQHKIGPGLAEAPQRGAEALRRVLGRAISPQNVGQPCPHYRPVRQGKIGQHALGTVRNPQLPSRDDQFELPYQGQPGRIRAASGRVERPPRNHDPSRMTGLPSFGSRKTDTHFPAHPAGCQSRNRRVLRPLQRHRRSGLCLPPAEEMPMLAGRRSCGDQVEMWRFSPVQTDYATASSRAPCFTTGPCLEDQHQTPRKCPTHRACSAESTTAALAKAKLGPGIMRRDEQIKFPPLPVTISHLPVMRCQICHRTVTYQPGKVSAVLTEYRLAHPGSLGLPSRLAEPRDPLPSAMPAQASARSGQSCAGCEGRRHTPHGGKYSEVG